MRKWRFFLAYYTLITSLALFIWSIFFTAKPQGFLLTLLAIPTSLYFWLLAAGLLKSRSSDSPSENQNHERQVKYPLIVLTTLFISSLSVFVYSTANTRSVSSDSAFLSTVANEILSLRQEVEKLNQSKELYEKMVEELKEIKNELSNIQSGQEATGEATFMGKATSQVGRVTIKDEKYPTVNAYKDKDLSSEVIGKAEFDKTYTFVEKDQNWYLVLLGEKEGYIQSELVKEVSY